MAQTTETVPPERQGRPQEPASQIIEHIYELPFDAQLGVLRTVAPKILACMVGEEREGFFRDLLGELDKADRGEPSYDLRPNIPTY